MKKERKYFILILTLIGFCTSCQKKDEAAIDMSNIDFSNIENLYEQPLPVIQKCVEGKWKWVASFGGDAGVSYPENTYVEIDKDHFVVDYDNGEHRILLYTWKRYTFLTRNMKNITRWVMWNTEQDSGIFYFDAIKNDTLGVGVVPLPANYSPFSHAFVRVK